MRHIFRTLQDTIKQASRALLTAYTGVRLKCHIMIFQAWVMSRCNGKPSEAVRRLEAANGGKPIDRTRVYRALRKPCSFPVRFAQLVINASVGACTLFELVDLETIREHFEYTDPDLKRRALEYQVIRATRKRDTLMRQRDRLDVQLTAANADLVTYQAQIDALDDAARARAAG